MGMLLLNENMITFLSEAFRSSIFVVTLLGIGAGLYVFLSKIKSLVFFNWVDVFVSVVALGYYFFHFSVSNLWTMGTFSLLLIYWAIRLIPRLPYGFLYFGLLASTFILALTGYLQYAGIVSANHPYFAVTGLYDSPAIYGGVMCLLLSILFTWCLHTGYRKHYKFLYIITVLMGIICLPVFIIIGCRAAWVALLMVVARSVYLSRFRCGNDFFAWFRSHAVFRVLIPLLIILSVYGLYRFKPDSADGRILIWKVTLGMVKEKPLTGFGPGGFTAHYMHYQASYLEEGGTPRERFLADSNHLVYNEPLRLMVDYGVAGFLLYACFLYIALIIPRKKDVVTLSAQSLLTSYLIWGLFAYPDQTFPMQVIALIALACLSHRCRKPLWIFRLAARTCKVLQMVLLIAAIGLAFTFTEKYRCHRKFYQIMNAYSSNRLDESVKELATMESIMQDESAYWIYYCMLLNKIKSDSVLLDKIVRWEELYPTPDTYIMKGDLWQRMGQYDKAETAYLLANWMVPSRQRARSRLALLYRRLGRNEEAMCIAHEILTEKVKVYGFQTHKIHEELKRIFENQIK